MNEDCPSLRTAYNPVVETDIATYDTTVNAVMAKDAVRAPRRETQGQAVTTLAAWPRNCFRKFTVVARLEVERSSKRLSQ